MKEKIIKKIEERKSTCKPTFHKKKLILMLMNLYFQKNFKGEGVPL